MFTLLAYNGNDAGPATNFDLTAAVDQDYTQRNGHYTFTEPYKLLYDHWVSATCIRTRYQVPDWNAIGEMNGFPFNRQAQIVGNPPLVGYYGPDGNSMPPIPQNEEFQMQMTSTVAEQKTAAIVIGTPNWNNSIPVGNDPMSQPICVRATASVAGTLNSWTGAQAMTFSQSLRGGVYAVIGAQLQQATTALYFRLVFPRTKMYASRKMRPGWLAQNALGDQESSRVLNNRFHLGVWGYFHTFELPSFETFCNAAGAATQEIRLWLVYLGANPNILDQMLNQQH